MLYTPKEIAIKFGTPIQTIREWIKRGSPIQKDEDNHVWINGDELAEWIKVNQLQKKESHKKMAIDEAYCMHCRKQLN